MNWNNTAGDHSFVSQAGENTKAKILDVTTVAGITLKPEDIIIAHRVGNPRKQRPVSYTHLTLPTICSV